MINILSVDWDYFIGSTLFQRAHFFPDVTNDNMRLEFNAMLWNNSYAHSDAAKGYCDQKSIMEIIALDDENSALYALVEKYRKPDTKCLYMNLTRILPML